MNLLASKHSKKIILIILGVGLISIIVIFYMKFSSQNAIILDSPTGGNFTISSTQGEFNLKDQTGLITFVFFGFTHCPDICPLTLKNIQQMYTQLSPEDQKKLKVLFISVDNERDTLEKLSVYMKAFNSEFIGATANDEDLNKILKMYGARFTKIKNEVTKDIYIDHTSQVFIINSKNEWADTLKHNSSAEEFVDAFRTADLKNLNLAINKKSRIVPVIAQNNECNLSDGPCEIITFDQKTLKVEIKSLPVEIEKDLTIEVVSSSEQFIPLEVDFEGVELNMGLIRPKLKYDEQAKVYSGDFYLPLCEVSEMTWVARVIVKDRHGQLGAFNFTFKTLQ